MRSQSLSLSALALMTALASSQASAAGFEGPTMWGAHENSLAGIGTPWVQGANSLYFNPAGLAKDKQGMDFSLQASPMQTKFQAPINFNNDQATSDNTTAVPGGLGYSWTLNPNFGWGIGYYNVGGSQNNFANVPFAGTAAGTANVSNNLVFNELSIGAGYKINDQWKVGFAWRAVMTTASFSVTEPIAASTAAFMNLQVNNAKATDYTGFRFGVQYQPAEKTKIGLTFRSETNFKGDGKFGGFVSSAGVAGIDETTATLHSTLPMQIALGVQHEYEHWRALFQYDWTQYSRLGEVPIDGIVTAAGGGVTIGAIPALQLHWRDQHEIRLAGEYIGMSWPVRFGYVWTNAVSDASYALPGQAPPGQTHQVTLGTGHSWDFGGSTLTFDAGVNYGTASGSGEGAAAGQPFTATQNATRAGTYSASGPGFDLGLAYAF